MLTANYLNVVSKKAGDIDQKLDKKSEKALAQLQKQEEKLRRKLFRLDSSKAKELFVNAEAKYGELENKIKNPAKLTQYIPYLDTLKTSFKFLENNKELLGKAKDLDKSLNGAAEKIKGLESSLAKA